jgi:hypothetical protein
MQIAPSGLATRQLFDDPYSDPQHGFPSITRPGSNDPYADPPMITRPVTIDPYADPRHNWPSTRAASIRAVDTARGLALLAEAVGRAARS